MDTLATGMTLHPETEHRDAFVQTLDAELVRRIGSQLLQAMARVNQGRRRAARCAQLLAGNRAVSPPDPALISASVSEWAYVLEIVKGFVAALTPETIRAADVLVAEIDDPTKPSARLLEEVATVGMGFSAEEHAWLVAELRRAGLEPLRLISDSDPQVLRDVCAAVFVGDNGLLQLGFIDLGSKPETNRQVQLAFGRARRCGITLSVFLLLPAMILVAAGHPQAADTPLGRAARARATSFSAFS